MEDKIVLVIEDNEMNMKLTVALLKIGKYRVIEAKDAESGIQLARIHRPDLILMDLQLPRMDGLTATRMIRKDPALKNIPVVALTAHAMQGDDERATEAGCVGYIAKPIDTHTFLDCLSQFMRQGALRVDPPKSKQPVFTSRVLIVDDDPLSLKLMAAKLPLEAYEVTTATNGEEALKKAAEKIPDLILLDVMMPGTDGYEVARRLKNEPTTKDIPIIMVTALDSEEDKIKGLQAGADEFLNKPVNTPELLVRTKSLISLVQYRELLKSHAESGDVFLAGKNALEESGEDRHSPIVLLVEDDQNDAKLIGGFLEGEPYRVKTVKDGEEALTLASSGNIGLVLLDVLLPKMDGFEVCRRLKEMDQTKSVQVAMITCLRDLESKIQGINSGADDFLVKPLNRHELRVRVRALLRKKAYIDKLSTNCEIALNSAITDKLTGLYNQAYFKHFLDLELKRSLRQNQPIILAMIDIDDFKRYNDTLGHWVGDIILKELGQLLKNNLREVDLVARYGGEEFVALMPYTDLEAASKIVERLRTAIHGHSFLCEASLPPQKVSVSIGVAGCPWSARSLAELIQKADQALYSAKRDGKNRVCVCEGAMELSNQQGVSSWLWNEAPDTTIRH